MALVITHDKGYYHSYIYVIISIRRAFQIVVLALGAQAVERPPRFLADKYTRCLAQGEGLTLSGPDLPPRLVQSFSSYRPRIRLLSAAGRVQSRARP